MEIAREQIFRCIGPTPGKPIELFNSGGRKTAFQRFKASLTRFMVNLWRLANTGSRDVAHSCAGPRAQAKSSWRPSLE